MKILYLTSAQSNQNYEAFSKRWNVSLNISNQVFHHKLITALENENKINVFSIRPLNKNCNIKSLEEGYDEESSIRWIYPAIKSNKIARYLSLKKEFLKIIRDLQPDYLFVDGLNLSALMLSKLTTCKKVCICTDRICDISGIKKKYSKRVLKLAKNFDAYLCLTDGLNNYYNVNGKPSLITEGIIQDRIPINHKKYSNYFFYAGNLLEKFGINNLIKAFNLLANPEYKLLIAGHHHEQNLEFLSLVNRSNVVFLGCIDNDTIFSLESNSIANINPRPVSDLDLYSFPSKTLEYLSSGSTTISTKNPILYSKFKDEIIWAENNSVEELKKALAKALTTKKNGKEKAIELYSTTSISKKIQKFLLNLSK